MNNQILEEKKDILYSLAPNYESEELGFYEDYITEALEKNIINEAKDKTEYSEKLNRNIAISGGFGAGKSSVIRSYFYKHRNTYKPVYVTLGSYIEEQEDDNVKIELSILQQILYVIRPHQLSFSRFKRIDKDKWHLFKKSAKLTTAICLLFFFSYTLINLENLRDILENNNKGIYILMFFGFVFVLFVFAVIKYAFHRFSLNKIELYTQPFKTEASELNSHDSILNNNVEELINFFAETNYDIIVFEDIDRINNSIRIFSKLKEINDIINNAITGKTIRFIYAIGDEVFYEAEKRTKFFDCIIPIVPYTGYGNSKEKLQNIFKKYIDESRIHDDILNDISNIINNTRNIYDVYNEFEIYLNRIEKKSDQKLDNDDFIQLLYLIIYKIQYSKKYKMLENGTGKISYYFSDNFIEDVKEYITEEKIENLQILSNVKKFIKDNNIDDSNKKIIILDIINSIIAKKSKIEIKLGKKCIYQIPTLFDNLDFLTNLSGKEIISFEKESGYEETIDIYKILGCYQKKFFPKYIDFLLNRNTFELDQEIKINNDIDFDYNKVNREKRLVILRDITLKQNFLEKNKVEKEDYELNEFEKKLIIDEIINEKYKRLIASRTLESLTINDEKVLNKIRTNKMVEEKIDDVEKLYTYLSRYDFRKDSICNIQIFEYIIGGSTKFKSNIEEFFKSLSNKKLRFIMELDQKNINIFKSNVRKINKVWEFIYENRNFINENIISYYIYITIDRVSPNIIDKDSKFYEFASSTKNVINILEKNYERIKNKITKFNIIFNKDVEFKQVNKKMMNLIYNNNMFSICMSHIEILHNVNNLKFNKNKIFSSIYNNKFNTNSILYDVLEYEEKYNILIDEICSKQLIQKETCSFCENILFEKLNIKAIEKLLPLVESKIKHLNNIKKENIDLFIDMDKVEVNWNNIKFLYLYFNNSINIKLSTLINENYRNLLKGNANVEVSFINDFLTSELITYKAFQSLIKIILNEKTEYIDNVEREKNIFLIENDLIKVTSKNEFEKICTLIDLNINQKIKLFINNFDNLKSEEIYFSPNGVEKILTSDRLNNSDKIVYILCNNFVFNMDYIINKYAHLFLDCDFEIPSDMIIEILYKNININIKTKILKKFIYIEEEYELIDIYEALTSKCVSKKDDIIFVDNNKDNYEIFFRYTLLLGLRFKLVYNEKKISLKKHH